MITKLRHPIRAIREPFGTAGLIVAIIALVLALTGAAFAAAGLTGKQKKEVEKIAKKFAGKPGAPGSNGANGTSGAPGERGPQGEPGKPGENGKNGTSAEAVAFTGEKTIGSVTCHEGGLEVKSAKPAALICNGEKGTTGFTATLPKGSTETGVFALLGEHQSFETEVEGSKKTIEVGSKTMQTAISFPIPLAQAPTPQYVPEGVPAAGEGELTSGSKMVTNLNTTGGNFTAESLIAGTGIPAGTTIKKCLNGGVEAACNETHFELELSAAATASGTQTLHTVTPPGCAGKASEPEAEEGNLCAFAENEKNAESVFGFGINFVGHPGGFNGASGFGTVLVRQLLGPGEGFAYGTWAVTSSE